tara:strand:- start:9130 stop:9465 length:336 start_codon:yes stop_codon:yes gene_type:complete
MAITQTRIDGSAEQLGTAVFTATADTAVTTIHLCNISSAADASINIYLLPSDGSTTVPTENNKIYNQLTVQATDTYIIDTEKLILANGDKIFIELPDSSGQIIATISTIGL